MTAIGDPCLAHDCNGVYIKKKSRCGSCGGWTLVCNVCNRKTKKSTPKKKAKTASQMLSGRK